MNPIRKYSTELIILVCLGLAVGIMFFVRPGRDGERSAFVERATSTVSATRSSAGASVLLPVKNTNTPTITPTPLPTKPTSTNSPDIVTPTPLPSATPTLVATRTMIPAEDNASFGVPLALVVSPGGTSLWGEPNGEVVETLPEGVLVQLYPDDREIGSVVWSHVATFTGNEGWMRRAALKIVSNLYADSDACSAIRSSLPAGIEYITVLNGSAKKAVLHGVSSGETKTVVKNGVTIDLARLYYLASTGELHDDLWVATGMLLPDGTYSPMRSPNSTNEWAWESMSDGEQMLSSAGIGVQLSLTGFVRPNISVVWEECSAWAAYSPPGICEIGLDLDVDSRSGSAVFLRTGLPIDGWYLFGWDVEMGGKIVSISESVSCSAY